MLVGDIHLRTFRFSITLFIIILIMLKREVKIFYVKMT
jgi:hypothetical protein